MRIMIETFNIASLASNANVVEASNCQATIFSNIDKTLFLPSHENVSVC